MIFMSIFLKQKTLPTIGLGNLEKHKTEPVAIPVHAVVNKVERKESKKPGRPVGTTKDRAKLNTTIDAANLAWLRHNKRQRKISAVIDQILYEARGIEK
jgi:hypothetical protein